ncbi:cytochrome c-type biogenesis protein [Aliiroseovarius sediminilitoris]|uniref:Cytochrome c-type biogenesis protein n=1 Tax=Aliiroseovarius sediminilitoris TaxID=1173584 RepID=A0A1I0QUP6_9RHOB|nr:cytochrome c biogenesis protein CcdA [Aliiroseovarius sediminilitoris]SEW31143.1 cytochrome c-type biogenesis protein [Aliiroseovarius sediminilitoris]
MEITFQTLLLAFGLGLLGFIEPCTIGAHMLFLGGQRARSMGQRISAAFIFILARLVVMGGFGGLIVVLGQRLIGVQTSAWLVFGAIYLGLGFAIISGWDKTMRHHIGFAPERWKVASNPLLQGLAFGLNIPACAAPILFGLMGTATFSGSAATGFLMMAVFALALSLPLVPLSIIPGLARPLERLADWLRPRRWLVGVIFVGLGVWSAWFGLFVEPVDWSGT